MVGQVKYKYKGDSGAPNITTNMLENGVINSGGAPIIKLAIQAPMGTQVLVNGKNVTVGYTRIYDLPDRVKVTSLAFVNKEDLKDILIDYITE